jgi:hypothetical protein
MRDAAPVGGCKFRPCVLRCSGIGSEGTWVLAEDGFHRAGIHDFSKRYDKMSVSKIDAKPAVAGDQAFVFIGTKKATGAGQIRYQFLETGE